MIRVRGDASRSPAPSALRCLLGRHPLLAALPALLALSSVPLASAADKKPKPPKASPPAAPADAPPVAKAVPADACAEARGSARYEGYGYTHVVTLHNGCEKPVECALWTDVDAEPRTTVQLAPGQSIEIVTRRGSPAREVVAQKSCRYR